MQKWKAILLVAAILVQSFYCPVMAREARFLETAAPVLDLSAKSAVVMEQESKEILFAKDKDKELAPASVTKIMSLLLIFEDLKQGKINLQIRLQSVNMQHLWAALRCFWKQERSSRYKH